MDTIDMSFYQFYRKGDVIIAVSTYAGKTVKGYAKCAPNDKYNEWYGKVLAAARCNEKVARKRAKRAEKKSIEAHRKLIEAFRHDNAMMNYQLESNQAYADAIKFRKQIEAELS